MKTSRLFISALIGMAALTGCQPAVKTNNVCNDTCTCPATTEEVPVALLTDTPVITAPPAELKLDPFYKKYMSSVPGAYPTPVSTPLISVLRL